MKIYRSKVDPRKIDLPDKSWGILTYDEKNDYPERTGNIVAASGTARNCVKTYSKFIEGRGFNDPIFYKAKINKNGLTNDKLLRRIAFDFALRDGFAVHVNYNALFEIVEYTPIFFKDTRLPNPEKEFEKYHGKIAIHPDWTGRFKRVSADQIQWIDKFNRDPNEIQKQVDAAEGWQNYKGQVLWYSSDEGRYPTPVYDPVLEDIETDARIKSRRRKKAATDYAPDYWFITYGEFEDDYTLEDFSQDIEQDQGDQGSSMKLIGLKQGETKPELLPVPQAAVKTNYSIENETKAQGNIRKAFGWPSILIGEDVPAGLGAVNTLMEESYAIANSITYQERLIMEETFKTLFEGSKIAPNAKGDYSIQKSYFDTGNEKAPLAVQFGVGGTQSVTNILIDPALQPAQKINTLIILFGLSETQATSMVTGAKIPTSEKPE